MQSFQRRTDDNVFELTRDELDELPFGVITLDRRGKILRYNRAEESLSGRAAHTTVGLDFFADVAPCTNVRAFRGRFDVFAHGHDSGVERFDFSFHFRWGREDVSIAMLRKAGREEINILVRGHFMGAADEDASLDWRARPEPPLQSLDGATVPTPPHVVLQSAQPTFCRLGLGGEAAPRSRIHVDDADAVSEVVAAALASKTSYAIEYRSLRPDNSVSVMQEFGTFALGLPGSATIVDVSVTRQTEYENWRAARYDALTGLPNRNVLVARIVDATREAQDSGLIAAVLVANIDKFREFNDTYGHDVGNELLRMVALRLGECVRGGDAVARVPGVWFAVLLTGVDSGASVAEAATRLIAAVSRPFIIAERQYFLSLSVGVSVAPYDSCDPEVLLRCADTAMLAAKQNGGNGFRWYSSEMTADTARNALRLNELRAALENQELELHYQPIVDVAADRIVGVEALVRWNHPARGFLPPAEFIELADRTGLIIPLGEWVLREACRQAHEWSVRGFDLRVCVNVSAVQFRQPNFVALVESIIAESGLAAEQLELELTESVMVDGFAEMMDTLSRLKSLGLRLAIDDFGTGYSSLAYLKYFPVDTLKIDRAFVTEIVADKFDRSIATAVLTLANELGLDCVVEGVEDASQLDTLVAIGCTVMQGYYFCRPKSPAHLAAILGASVSSRAPGHFVPVAPA